MFTGRIAAFLIFLSLPAFSEDLMDIKLEEDVEFINYADRVINFDIKFNITSNDALFEEGYYYYKIEDYENALRKLEDYLLVCTNPELREYALFMAGLSAIRLGDYKRAISLFEGITYLAYLEDYRHYYLAYAMVKSGDFEKAMQELETIQREYPATILTVEIEFLKLDIFISRNNYAEIIEQAKSLLDIIADSSNYKSMEDFLIFNIAKSYLALNDIKSAKEYLFRIYTDYPFSNYSKIVYDILTLQLRQSIDVTYRMARADKLFSKQLYRNALDEYLRVEGMLKNNPDKRYADIKRRLILKKADCYFNLKEASLARELYSSLLEDSYYSPDMKAYFMYRIASLAKRGADNSEAIRLYSELASKYPRSKYADEARYLSIWLKYNDGKYDEAIAGFKEFVKRYRRSPKRLDALWFLGINLYKKKAYSEAFEYFYEIKRSTPNSENLKPAAIYFLARLSCEMNRMNDCRDYYINLIENFPLNYYSLMAQNRLSETFGEDVPFPDNEGVYDISEDDLSISRQPERFNLAQEGILRFNKALQLIRLNLENYAKRELDYLNVKMKDDYRVLYFLSTMRHRAGDYYGSMRVLRGFFIDKMIYRPSQKEIMFWKRMFPLAYLNYVIDNARKYNLDPLLILAIMREESHFRYDVVSPAGAVGLMQLMPKTGRLISNSLGIEDFDEELLNIPEINIQLGCWYMNQLIIKFNGQLPFAIAAYNAGPGAVDRWLKKNKGLNLDLFIEEIPYKETRGYVKRVLQTYGIYNYIYRNKDRKKILPLRQSFESESKDNINF